MGTAIHRADRPIRSLEAFFGSKYPPQGRKNLWCRVPHSRYTLTMIRVAEEADAADMAALSSNFRDLLESYSPVFWRKKEGIIPTHTTYMKGLINNPNQITLVYEQDGKIEGFITGLITQAPPVYDPGGPVCLVDDFVVRDARDWSTVGKELIQTCENSARFRNAVVVIVVSPIKCMEQREMLRDHGVEPVSEWRIKIL